MRRRTLACRKLLVASVGVATVSYVVAACGGTPRSEFSGDASPPAADDVFVIGNPFPPDADAGPSALPDGNFLLDANFPADAADAPTDTSDGG